MKTWSISEHGQQAQLRQGEAGLTLCRQLLVVNQIDKVRLAWGFLDEAAPFVVAVQVNGRNAISEGCIVGAVVVPAGDGVWRLAARRAGRTPGPEFVAGPVEGGDGGALEALDPAEGAHVDGACADRHGHRGRLEARNGDNGALDGLVRERRAALHTGDHEISAALQLLDDDERRVEQRHQARVVPQRVDGRVHALGKPDPQHALVAGRALVAADVDGARHLAEVGPRRRGEARGEGIFGQQRLAQRGEARRGRGLVVGGRVGGQLDAKVCDDLVGGAAAVAGLERRERLDLRSVSCLAKGARAQAEAHMGLLLEHGGRAGAVCGRGARCPPR